MDPTCKISSPVMQWAHGVNLPSSWLWVSCFMPMSNLQDACLTSICDCLQIWPVLCAGSAHDPDRNTHSLHMSVNSSPAKGSMQPSADGATNRNCTAGDQQVGVELHVQQLTVWLGFPLLRRLQGFFQPLLRHQAQQAITALRCACASLCTPDL